MIPLIMAAISMAQKKAQSENQDLQNMANNMRQPLQIQQPQQQFPTINSVFVLNSGGYINIIFSRFISGNVHF